MTLPNSGHYFPYSSQSGNSGYIDDHDLNEPGSSNIQPDYSPRNSQSASQASMYSLNPPPTHHNPHQIHIQQPFQPTTQQFLERGGSSLSMVGYLPTPVGYQPPLEYSQHPSQQSQQTSSAFYSHLQSHPVVYQTGDHQAGHHSSHYQNPPSSNLQYNPHYPINMPYYPYTPIQPSPKGYRPPVAAAHTAPLTDIPSAADQGTLLPGSMGNATLFQSSYQGRIPRNKTIEVTAGREERGELTFVPHELRRPSSTPSLSINNSQLMTPSSPSISLTSPSTPDPTPSVVVSFAQDQSSSLPHTMVEDKSISQDELHTTFFPPSSRINVPSTSGSIQNSKWTCQWENCHDLVRSQDRMAHALEHYGKKRFTCSCGHTFARSQDKKRHLREQAICDICQLRPVGRNGKEGRCPSCRSLSTLRR